MARAGAAAGRRRRRRPAARRGRSTRADHLRGGRRARGSVLAERGEVGRGAVRAVRSGGSPSAGVGVPGVEHRAVGVGDGGQAVAPGGGADVAVLIGAAQPTASRSGRPARHAGGRYRACAWQNPLTLDLTPTSSRSPRALCRHRVGQRRRAGARRRGRGGAAPAGPPRGDRGRQHGGRPHRPRAGAERVVLAGHLDTVPLTDEPARPGATGDELYGRGTCDMKGGVAVLLRLAAAGARADPRRHLRLLRLRGGRGRAQRARAASAATRPELLAGRLRGPARADQRRRRGRLPGHAAGRGHRPRRARRTRPGPGRASTRSTPRATVLRPAGGVRGRRPVESTGWTTTRAQRGRHQRRRRRQRDPRRVRGRRSTTGSPRTDRRGGRGARARGVRRASTWSVTDARRGARPGPATCPRPQAFVDGGRRPRRAPSSAGPTSPGSPRSASRR